jgi:Uma2 family endonuclease
MTTATVPALKTFRFTVEDYHRLWELGVLPPHVRTELLNGNIVEMSPINSLHAGTVNRISRLISELLDDSVILSVQNPVALSAFSEPEPDIALLRLREDFYSRTHPTPTDVLCLIEVADTTVFKDRSVKIPLYAAAGIPEVWLVDLPAGCVEVYAQPEGEQFNIMAVYDRDAVLQSPLAGAIPVKDILG